MAKRYYDNWLKAFVEYASFGEAPLKFYFWTGVSTIAGALRRRVWIHQGHFDWVPNFYIIFVAPPGVVSKSTTASIGKRLLSEVPGVKFGPDAVTWQALVQSLAASKELVLQPDGSFFPMSAVTIVSSEFGNLFNPKDTEMVDVFVSLWDGQQGVWQKMTKTMGNDLIENPCINIIACTTPAWIAGNFPEYMIGGGFTSRCIFVFADVKRQLIAYPSQHIPPDFLETQHKLIHDLTIISELFGAYTLDNAALAWGNKWYEEHFAQKPAQLNNARFEGYLARKQTHIHKLAMIIAASQRDALVIQQGDLEMAAEIVTTLEHDMPAVFSEIGRTDDTRKASELVQIVRAHGSINKKDLYRLVFKTMRGKDFEESLAAANNAGYLAFTQVAGQVIITTRQE